MSQPAVIRRLRRRLPCLLALSIFSGASSTAAESLDLPLMLEKGKIFEELFEYRPEYQVNLPTFDQGNRPYIRSRGTSIHDTAFVQTLRDGEWVKYDFLETVRQAYPNFESFDRGGGWLSPRVVFDNQDRAYTLLRLHLNDEPGQREILLSSTDHGRSWAVTEILQTTEKHPDGVVSETRAGFNRIEGPPFLILSRPLGEHPDRWATYHELSVTQPHWEADQVIIPEPVVVTGDLLSIGQHSGNSSFSVTRGRKTHFVWIGINPEPEEDATLTWAATFDHRTNTVGDKVLLGKTSPRNDTHNRPGIVMDSSGYLHVVLGSHGREFLYTRSLKRNEIYSGWTEPRPILFTGHLDHRIPEEGERGAQTYVSLGIDSKDTLHLVFRQARRNVDELFDFAGADVNAQNSYMTLSYQRKKKGEEWEDARILVVPEVFLYAIYQQSIEIDRQDRIFLSLVYVDRDIRDRFGDDRFQKPMLMMSDDGGDNWRLVETRDFEEGVLPRETESAPPRVRNVRMRR